MQTTANMSLVVWDDLDDPYDHNQLAGNFNAIDAHRHTGTDGRQLVTNSYTDKSVTRIKLADDCISSPQIENYSILGEDLANGIIGTNHLSAALLSKLVPMGTVTPWFRPSNATQIPQGWVICTGQTLGAGAHEFPGVTDVTLPDLRNKFILGAAESGTGTTPDVPPAEKASGGQHSRSLAHTHTVPDHFHGLSAHNHGINGDGYHSHGISNDGAHRHKFAGDHVVYSRGLAIESGSVYRQSLYLAGFNGSNDSPSGPAVANMDVQPAHNHGGAVTYVADHNHGGGTMMGGAGQTGTVTGVVTGSESPGGDLRPAYVGLLMIMKVKNPT